MIWTRKKERSKCVREERHGDGLKTLHNKHDFESRKHRVGGTHVGMSSMFAQNAHEEAALMSIEVLKEHCLEFAPRTGHDFVT
jgi:hypothetical protein